MITAGGGLASFTTAGVVTNTEHNSSLITVTPINIVEKIVLGALGQKRISEILGQLYT